MFDSFVVNASPLIFLWSVDGLEWVARLSAHAVRIPHSVVAEVEAGLGGKEIIDTIRGDRRFEIAPDALVPPLVAAWDLGPGESQVLAECMRQPGVTAVLDDRSARECAQRVTLALSERWVSYWRGCWTTSAGTRPLRSWACLTWSQTWLRKRGPTPSYPEGVTH